MAAGSLKRALARGSRGCLVCDGWNDEMITVVEQGTKICRPCSIDVGRRILRTSPPVVARLWAERSSVPQTQPEVSPSCVTNAEAAFSALKATIAVAPSPEDAPARFDLAWAYAEMGLTFDAIREAAIALGAGAPLPLARRALNWIFARERAHPDALRAIVASVRDRKPAPQSTP